MANRRVRHNKFFKFITVVGASLGFIASTFFTVCLTLDAIGVNPFLTDELRTYTATFVNEGAVIEETRYKRGQLITQPNAPSHPVDGENNYFFLGWDTTGNGLLDVLPPRMYYSFTARAVYLKVGKFDLSFLDFTNLDLETLLNILDQLDIDWEQFMEMFNIDPETLLDWLKDEVAFSFEADASKYISYFRSTSYGNFNYAKKRFELPSSYDSNLISENSVNPLTYTADKLNTAYNMSGTLLDTFSFVNYDINYVSAQEYYPVPDCMYPSDEDNRVDSDAHYSINPVNNSYHASAAYIPATSDVISILRMARFSNNAIINDEANYYRYALEKYTTIPKEYEGVIDDIIAKQNWKVSPNGTGYYDQVDSIGNYVEHLGACSYFRDGEIDYNAYMKGLNPEKNGHDPVNDLITSGLGSPWDFNTTAMMIFRRLRIPARMVKGYLIPMVQQGHNSVYILNTHYWCEIYVSGVGWMICDCTNAEEILGTNPYGELDKDNNPLEDEFILDSIDVEVPDNLEFTQGDDIESGLREAIEATANFTNGDSKEIDYDDLEIDYDPNQIGEQTVTVTYTYKDGQTETETFTMTINEKPDTKGEGDAVFHTDATPKEFIEGDEFTYNGITATVTYEDGSKVEVQSKDIEVDYSDVDMSTPGTYTVKVSTTVDEEYFEDSYEITVKTKPVEEVEIHVKSEPTKTSYYEGEAFDPTGLEIEVELSNGETVILNSSQYVITGISGGEMSQEDEHHVVTVTYTNPDTKQTFTTTFEIEIKDNPIATIDVDASEVDYSVGDYFDLDEFMEEITAVANLEYGGQVTIKPEDISSYSLVSAPDLSAEGQTTVTIKVTIEDKTYTVNIPVNVGGARPENFSLSPSVATSGPGEMDPVDVFSFKTDHIGTVYFRARSYASYNNATWAEPTTNNQGEIFTYDKASQIYKTDTVDVKYLMDCDCSLLPVYSYSNVSGSKKKNTETKDLEFTTFELTEENYNRLANYAEYSSRVTVSSSISYNSYRNSVVTSSSPYLNKNAPAKVNTEIASFIASNGILPVNSSNKIEKALLIRSILKSYTYDKDFKYESSSEDPVYSFLHEKKGICSDFASAATLIYRNVGIPARYCTGFGENSDGTEKVVTSNRAHAWTEIWLDNLGWVVVDCTGYDTSKDKGPGEEYYGTPFADGDDEDLYNFKPQGYETEIGLQYSFNPAMTPVSENEFEIEYCGLGYKDLISITPVYNKAVLPSYLEVKVYLVEVGKETEEASNIGRDVNSYSYEPKLVVTDLSTDRDVTAEYGFTLSGARTISYSVSPRVMIVNIAAVGTITEGFSSSQNSYFSATPDESTPIASGDKLTFVLTSAVEFPYAGTYSDYSDKFAFTVMRSAENVTDNYIIIPICEPVEVKPN